MKFVVTILSLFTTLSALAASTAGIICREDQRLKNGPLKEFILTPTEGGYIAQSQFSPSIHSSGVTENWAEKLSCRIDEKSTLAFCHNQQDHVVAQVKERREVFYDSLEENAKKKTNKYIDISITEKDVEKKAISFAASHCQAFGGEA